jgi:hypothetical protein
LAEKKDLTTVVQLDKTVHMTVLYLADWMGALKDIVLVFL